MTPPKESPDKEITEFLNTLWSIGALQQLMPELLEYKKLHRKKVWNIEINTFSGLVGFEFHFFCMQSHKYGVEKNLYLKE